MRDYGKVYTRFWLKQNVLSWSDSAKLLGLYLLTCPHCNLLGCFRLPIGYVASDLNWDEQQVAKALSELEQDQFLIRCEESGWTLIPSFLKHTGTSCCMVVWLSSRSARLMQCFSCARLSMPRPIAVTEHWQLVSRLCKDAVSEFRRCLLKDFGVTISRKSASMA